MDAEMVKDKVKYKFFDKTYDVPQHYYTNKDLDDPACPKEIVRKNCQKVVESMNGKGVVILRQIHGKEVHFATTPTEYALEPEADAAVTTTPGLILAIQTADCVPVLFACKTGKVIGAAHCGWKSTKLDIVDEIVQLMQKHGAMDIVAIIGPAIQQKSYEVDQFYRDSFVAGDKGSAEFFKNGREGYFFFDLPSYVERKLNLAGIAEVTAA